MTNRSSVAPAPGPLVIVKGDDRRDPVMTKWFYWFNSRLVLVPVIPKKLKRGVVSACMVLRMN